MATHADRPEALGIERGKLLAVSVLAVVVAAASWALMSFSDRGVACGSALTSAVNGKPVLLNGAGGVLATGGQAKAFSFDEAHPFFGIHYTVACRQPARHRLALSATGIVLATIGLIVGSRTFRGRRVQLLAVQ